MVNCHGWVCMHTGKCGVLWWWWFFVVIASRCLSWPLHSPEVKSDLQLVGSREMPDSSPLQGAAMLPWAGMHPGKGEHAQNVTHTSASTTKNNNNNNSVMLSRKENLRNTSFGLSAEDYYRKKGGLRQSLDNLAEGKISYLKLRENISGVIMELLKCHFRLFSPIHILN